MPEFNKDRFLGKWFEAERLFTVTELASKCISATYEKRPDGQIWIDNSITNRFTGVERKISGLMKMSGKFGEGTYNVRYNSLPINYDTTLNVLDTDYDSFAVIYSCSALGSVGHTQSVWVMTRERFPTGPTLQKAYGVLDKFRITRSFFIKTDQSDCEILPPPVEAYDPTSPKPESSGTVS
ncbi:unnamed protein product [Hermetia illucens]|uniref:Lipocalin/cytosolic fatty-acid binding domain-containing protein n=2 Tax=Hermetia illucens TaxID=343691 RepID=A0A7R8YPF9_HERIL|nr:unnamed protein product [Hermetia illucens]